MCISVDHRNGSGDEGVLSYFQDDHLHRTTGGTSGTSERGRETNSDDPSDTFLFLFPLRASRYRGSTGFWPVEGMTGRPPLRHNVDLSLLVRGRVVR